MRKPIVFILSVLSIAIALSSCSKSKTAQEMMRDQQKAIKKYIDWNDIKLIKEEDGKAFPKEFKENEYYLTSDGLYIQVIDTGIGVKYTTGEYVNIRFDTTMDIEAYVTGDVEGPSTISHIYFPYTLIYGLNDYTNANDGKLELACDGWIYPLRFVGKGAAVNLIVPSKHGSSYDSQYYRARTYTNLRYVYLDIE